jgi:hypothetical protein
MRPIGLLVTALLTFASACMSQEFNIGTPNACSGELLKRYSAFDLEQGINGYDNAGFHISTYKAHTNLVIVVRRYWQPYMEDKQPLCGKLNHFGWFHTTWTNEQDWNNVVTPYGPFQQMLQDAVALGTNENEMVDCPSGHKGDCLELEVTPQKQFWTNRFFGRGASHYEVIDTKYDGITPLVDQNVCFYGPWVNDAAHGSRPEIHPTELVWWRDDKGSTPSADHWYMIGITDDSDRFDENGHFDLPSPVPVGWRPWAYRPYDAVFRVPFALDSSGASYHVGAYNANTLNSIGSNDPTAVLNVNGQPLVTVHKPTQTDIVKVAFSSDSDTCTDSNRRIHGYFDLQLQAGNLAKTAKGSFMLQLAKDPIPLSPVKDNLLHEDEQEADYIRGSLFATSTDHQRVLSGEFKIRPSGRTRFFSVQPDAVHKCKQDAGDCVSMVLLGTSARTHPELFRAQVLATPPIALTYSRSAQVPPTRATGEANPGFVRALKVSTLPPGILPVRQNKQVVRIDFAYAAIKDGHPALEEDSPPVTDLNQALYQRNTKMHTDLFGEKVPFTVPDQQFTVFDETDQTKLSGGNARLYCEGGEWQIEANFPTTPADHLMRGEFSAEAFDAFGDAVKIDEHFWNGALQVVKEGKSFNDILDAVAALVGLNPKAIDQAEQTPSTPGFPDFDDSRLHALAFRTRVTELLQDTDTLQYDDFLQLRNFAETVKRR